jgi:hypothetical protein
MPVVVKIEFEPSDSTNILDLSDSINELQSHTNDNDEDIQIEITHVLNRSNRNLSIILKTEHLNASPNSMNLSPNSSTYSIDINVIIMPSKSKEIIRTLTDSPLIINEMSDNVRLTIRRYRVRFVLNPRTSLRRPLLTNHAYQILNIQMIVKAGDNEENNELQITQNRADNYDRSNLSLNRKAYDLLKGGRNKIKVMECLNNEVHLPNTLNHNDSNIINLSSPTVIAGIVHNFCDSRIRIDSHLLIENSMCFGVLCSVGHTVHNVSVTVNGNVRFSNSRISGTLAGSIEMLSDSALKVRGTIIMTNDTSCNVIGLMTGICTDVSGDIKIDVRERVMPSTDIKQFGIISGIAMRNKTDPYHLYLKSNRMLYDLEYYENSFKKSYIDIGKIKFRDIGSFNNEDVDEAINSTMILELNDNGTKTSHTSNNKVFAPKPIETVIKRGVDEYSCSYSDSSSDFCNQFNISERLCTNDNKDSKGSSCDSVGGIFRADSHIKTDIDAKKKARQTRFMKDDNPEDNPEQNMRNKIRRLENERSLDDKTHEITEIIESTRKAIQNKKTNSKERKLKTKIRYASSDDEIQDIPYVVTSKDKSEANSEVKFKNKASIRDRKSDLTNETKYQPPVRRREDREKQEIELFRSIAVKKKEYEDRRLSKSNQAHQNRLNRLKKSMNIF